MIVVAYQDRVIRNESELFEAYIEKQLNNPDNQGTYPPRKSPSQKQTLHYLVWLARKLEAEGETEFLIEGMQPSWLKSPQQKNVYRIIFVLIVGLIVGLIGGLTGGLNEWLIVGLILVLIGGLIGEEWHYIESVEKFKFSIKLAIGGLIVGLIGGLIGGILNAIKHFILRLMLYRNGDIPWNYAKFLEHAAKHRFIQRVGGRYRFMHDLLRKHFAQMPLS